jgi:hypothetical protein
MQLTSSIFVSIASYRDDELFPTLLDMVTQAQDPARIHITICWQDDNNIDTFISQGMHLQSSQECQGYPLYQLTYRGAHINVICVHYHQSQGVGWARALIGSCFAHEDFFLQIDSHCRFIHHWDSEMIAMLTALRPLSAKPLLSSYPPGYIPGEKTRDTNVNRLIFNGFTPEGLVHLSSAPCNASAPVRHGYLAAGFIFADGHFAHAVANDPNIFFIGEEISMAARAFTHGYDSYAPHRVLLWHYYTRTNSPKIWADHTEQAKLSGQVDAGWWERDKQAKQHVLNLLNIAPASALSDGCQLGTQRTLREFEYRIGVNLSKQKIHPDVIGDKHLSFFSELPQDDAQWQRSLLYFNQKLLTIPATALDVDQQNVAWWHIGIYQQNNKPIWRQQLTVDAMRSMLTRQDENTLLLPLTFGSQQQLAGVLRICPYFHTNEWGEIVEVAW